MIIFEDLHIDSTLYINLYITGTIYLCFPEHFRFMSLGSTTEIDEGAAMPPGRLTGGAQKPGEVVGYPTVM